MRDRYNNDKLWDLINNIKRRDLKKEDIDLYYVKLYYLIKNGVIEIIKEYTENKIMR